MRRTHLVTSEHKQRVVVDEGGVVAPLQAARRGRPLHRIHPRTQRPERKGGGSGGISGRRAAPTCCRSADCCASAPRRLRSVFYRLLVITRSSLQLIICDRTGRGGRLKTLSDIRVDFHQLWEKVHAFATTTDNTICASNSADLCARDCDYRNMSHLRISSCLLITLNKDVKNS